MFDSTVFRFFFFFQAEDGIRDVAVTGVQTCALPISPHKLWISGGPGCSGSFEQGLDRAMDHLSRCLRARPVRIPLSQGAGTAAATRALYCARQRGQSVPSLRESTTRGNWTGSQRSSALEG